MNEEQKEFINRLQQTSPVLVLDTVEQSHPHKWNAGEHCRSVVAYLISAKAAFIIIVAAVLHDIGKALTRAVTPEGKVTFFKHAEVGAPLAEKVLLEIAECLLGPADIMKVVTLVRLHMWPRLNDPQVIGDKAIRRLLKELDAIGLTYSDLNELALADTVSMTDDPVWLGQEVERMSALMLRVANLMTADRKAAEAAANATPSFITGGDIAARYPGLQGRAIRDTVELANHLHSENPDLSKDEVLLRIAPAA